MNVHDVIDDQSCINVLRRNGIQTIQQMREHLRRYGNFSKLVGCGKTTNDKLIEVVKELNKGNEDLADFLEKHDAYLYFVGALGKDLSESDNPWGEINREIFPGKHYFNLLEIAWHQQQK